jgi:hypothetical protein
VVAGCDGYYTICELPRAPPPNQTTWITRRLLITLSTASHKSPAALIPSQRAEMAAGPDSWGTD